MDWIHTFFTLSECNQTEWDLNSAFQFLILSHYTLHHQHIHFFFKGFSKHNLQIYNLSYNHRFLFLHGFPYYATHICFYVLITVKLVNFLMESLLMLACRISTLLLNLWAQYYIKYFALYTYK